MYFEGMIAIRIIKSLCKGIRVSQIFTTYVAGLSEQGGAKILADQLTLSQ